MGILDSILGLFGAGGGQAKEEPAAEAPAEVEEVAEEAAAPEATAEVEKETAEVEEAEEAAEELPTE